MKDLDPDVFLNIVKVDKQVILDKLNSKLTDDQTIISCYDLAMMLNNKEYVLTDNQLTIVWNVTSVSYTHLATYQSLSEVNVEKDAVIKQGDKIGTSGENVYESELKNHLHFILEKDNQALNPEKYFNQEVSKIAV